MSEQKHLASTEQPAPTDSPADDCWLLVIRDMEERREVGIAKYGKPVRAGNGRDPLLDAYQEALDLAVYLRQAIEEREHERAGKGRAEGDGS